MILFDIFHYSSLFFAGLILGSFYTALASRIIYFFYGPERKPKQSIWKKILPILLRPSFCFSCKKRIGVGSLLPIWGYIKNKGSCRLCKKPIGIGTLLGELYMGLLSLHLGWNGYSWAMIIFSLLFCGHLYISLLTDSRFFLLDPENAVFLFFWAIAYLLARYGFHLQGMQHHLLAFCGTFFFFGILFLASRLRGLGFGDVILASVTALFSGLPWILLVLQLSAAGSIVYIVFVKKNIRAPAPLGAAMALSLLLILPVYVLYENW